MHQKIEDDELVRALRQPLGAVADGVKRGMIAGQVLAR